eukprot:2103492-Amphidinium_carterae.2
MVVCVWWTFMLSPRKLAWAALWWKVAFILDVVTIAGYVASTEGIFNELNYDAMYPDQHLYFCFYIAIVVCVGVMMMAYATSNLRESMKLRDEEMLEAGS